MTPGRVSLLCAAPWLAEGPTMVSYGDIAFRPDVAVALMKAEGDIAITYDREWRPLWGSRFRDPLSDAETLQLDGDLVVDIGRRPQSLSEIQGPYMGLLRITRTGLDQIEQGLSRLAPREIDTLDMTTLLRRLIGWGVSIQGIPVDGGWVEVDSEDDLNLYHERLRRQGAPW